MKRIMMFLGLAGTCLMAISASAATFDFSATGVSGANFYGNTGLPVSADATFVTGVNTLTITLRNLETDPTAIGQCISGLAFTLSGGQTGGTLTSSLGRERTINSNGTYTDGAIVPAGWLFSGSTLFLNDLAGNPAAGPAHTLIGGPGAGGLYDLANNSITGNGPHNPFLVGDVTFTLNIAGLTAGDAVTGATFQFGTTPGSNTVPDGGSTVLLLGCALSAVGLIRRRLS